MKKSIWGALALAALVSLPTACQAHTTYEEAMKASVAHAKDNQYALAIWDLKEALKLTKEPKDKEQAWLNIAQAYVAQGDNARAREAWQTLLAMPGVSSSTKSSVPFFIAQSLSQDGLYDEAEAAYRQVLQGLKRGTADDEGRAGVRMMIGENDMSRGQYARARQEFSALLAEPTTPLSIGRMVQSRMGASYIQEGNWQDGRREATKLLGQQEAALLQANTSEDQRVSVMLISGAHDQLGDSYALEKQWDKAKTEYTQALADPRLPEMFHRPLKAKLNVLIVMEESKLPDKTMYVTYQAAMAGAETAHTAKNYESMDLALQQAIQMADNPLDQALATVRLAKGYQERGAYKAAALQMRSVIQTGYLTPALQLDARAALGQSETQLAHYDVARQEFAAVLAADTTALAPPDRQVAATAQTEAQMGLAQSYFLEKNYAQAQAEYEKLLKLPQLTPEQRHEAEKALQQIREAQVTARRGAMK